MVDCYLGEIRLFGGSFAPVGWHYCDGTLLPISNNEALFSLIGTAWGGNGTTNFGLPDLRGRVPIGQGAGGGLTPRTLGQTFGTSMVTITAATYPTHTHAFGASTVAATATTLATSSGLAALGVPTSGSVVGYVPPTSAGQVDQFNAASIVPQGGSQPHENLMPYQALQYIIAMQGIYPTRP
jgi:microcystin-dependent protein